MRPSPPLARLFVLAGIWGCSFLFIATALEGMSSTQVVLGRVAFGAAAMWLIVLVRREAVTRDWRIWGHLALLGLLSNVIPFYAFAWAEDGRIPSGLAGIYNAATPLATLLCVLVALPGERPTRARLAGLGCGFAGVLLVLLPDLESTAATVSGQLACLGAAVCYGAAITYTRRFLAGSRVSSTVLATGQVTMATIELGVVAPWIASSALHLNLQATLSIVCLGALGTGFAYYLFYGLIRDVGATTASTVTYLAPVVAVVLGVLVRGESITWNQVAGGIVVIVGVLVAEGRVRAGRRLTTMEDCRA